MNLDLNSLIAPVISFILGIGIVGTFLAKFIPKSKKYFKIAKEALDVVDTVVESLEIKAGEVKSTLTEDEMKNILKEAKELKEAFEAK